MSVNSSFWSALQQIEQAAAGLRGGLAQ